MGAWSHTVGQMISVWFLLYISQQGASIAQDGNKIEYRIGYYGLQTDTIIIFINSLKFYPTEALKSRSSA